MTREEAKADSPPMSIWVVAFKAVPLRYTSRRTMVVEAASAQDAEAVAQDALLREGDGAFYYGLRPTKAFREEFNLGAKPYTSPPQGRVL